MEGQVAQQLINLIDQGASSNSERGKGSSRGFEIEIAFREVRFFLSNYHKSQQE